MHNWSKDRALADRTSCASTFSFVDSPNVWTFSIFCVWTYLHSTFFRNFSVQSRGRTQQGETLAVAEVTDTKKHGTCTIVSARVSKTCLSFRLSKSFSIQENQTTGTKDRTELYCQAPSLFCSITITIILLLAPAPIRLFRQSSPVAIHIESNVNVWYLLTTHSRGRWNIHQHSSFSAHRIDFAHKIKWNTLKQNQGSANKLKHKSYKYREVRHKNNSGRQLRLLTTARETRAFRTNNIRIRKCKSKWMSCFSVENKRKAPSKLCQKWRNQILNQQT